MIEERPETMRNDDNESKFMARLYGASAREIFERLHRLDPKLNQLIQRFVYDDVWQLPPLSVRDKALVTVAALVAQSRQEQLRIHMIGFLASGGTLEELRAVIVHLSVYCGFPSALAALAVASELVESEGKKPPH